MGIQTRVSSTTPSTWSLPKTQRAAAAANDKLKCLHVHAPRCWLCAAGSWCFSAGTPEQSPPHSACSSLHLHYGLSARRYQHESDRPPGLKKLLKWAQVSSSVQSNSKQVSVDSSRQARIIYICMFLLHGGTAASRTATAFWARTGWLAVAFLGGIWCSQTHRMLLLWSSHRKNNVLLFTLPHGAAGWSAEHLHLLSSTSSSHDARSSPSAHFITTKSVWGRRQRRGFKLEQILINWVVMGCLIVEISQPECVWSHVRESWLSPYVVLRLIFLKVFTADALQCRATKWSQNCTKIPP